MKQVQKSDKDPLCYEIKYLESHTCNSSTSSTTKYSVAVLQEERNKGPKLVVTEESEDIVVKHMMKSEELMLSLDDLDNKKEIFRTFSFSNPETENVFDWKNLIEDMSPTTTSESGITNEFLSASSVFVVDSPTNDDDSCFSSLENILDLTHDSLWINN